MKKNRILSLVILGIGLMGMSSCTAWSVASHRPSPPPLYGGPVYVTPPPKPPVMVPAGPIGGAPAVRPGIIAGAPGNRPGNMPPGNVNPGKPGNAPGNTPPANVNPGNRPGNTGSVTRPSNIILNNQGGSANRVSRHGF